MASSFWSQATTRSRDHENIVTFAFSFFECTRLIGSGAPEGIWQGYDGEWRHVSQQLIALAEAAPAEKYSWRPASGVRSTSGVYMHIAIANFYLLSVTGPKVPADLNENMEKTVTSKAEVIAWLKRSLEAVKTAHAAISPKDLERKVKIAGREATVDGMYLRIIIHANEHMGQLIAYARMTGVVPPLVQGIVKHEVQLLAPPARPTPVKSFITDQYY
jgi:uncharacterized damage-inducible protein DinB